MTFFRLPPFVDELVAARNRLRDHFNEQLRARGQKPFMKFTFDGNLVGDIGECLAAELYGIRLAQSEGIDGYATNGRSVQIKTTGVGSGPAFRNTPLRADHLLFFAIDMEKRLAEIVYNGPEHLVIAAIPSGWKGQRIVSMRRMRILEAQVASQDKLTLIGGTG